MDLNGNCVSANGGLYSVSWQPSGSPLALYFYSLAGTRVLYKQTEDNQDVKHNPGWQRGWVLGEECLEGVGGGFVARCNSKPNKTLRNQKASDGKLQLCCVTVTVTCCSCLTKIQKVRGWGGGGGGAKKKNCEAEFRNFTLYLENCY